MNRWIVKFSDIKFSESIGGGSYGAVCKATVKNGDRAVKILKLSEHLSYSDKQNVKMSFLEEARNLCKVNSAKTVKIQGVSFDKHPCIIMDLVEGTDLSKLIYR